MEKIKIFTTGDGTKHVKLLVNITVPIYLPDHITEISEKQVGAYIHDLERIELGEMVLNAMDVKNIIYELAPLNLPKDDGCF